MLDSKNPETKYTRDICDKYTQRLKDLAAADAAQQSVYLCLLTYCSADGSTDWPLQKPMGKSRIHTWYTSQML